MALTVESLLKEAQESLLAQSTDALLKELLPQPEPVTALAVAVSTEGEILEKEAGVVDFLKRDIRSFARIRPGMRGVTRAISKEDAGTYQGLLRAGDKQAHSWMLARRAGNAHVDELQHAVGKVADPEGRSKVVRSFLNTSRGKRQAAEATEKGFEESLKHPKPAVASFKVRAIAKIKEHAPAVSAALGGGATVAAISSFGKKKEPANAN